MSRELDLTGLDAQDPLAYLAALGVLVAATDVSVRRHLAAPRMRFAVGALTTPVLHGLFESEDELVETLMADLNEVAGRETNVARDPFLTFTYPDEKGNDVHDLKPPLEVFRGFAEQLIEAASPSHRRSLDWAAATLTDVAVDRSGVAAKPFALHFTAGQQRFLTVALELLDGTESKPKPNSPGRPLDAGDLRDAVFGPWPNNRTLKVFSWSPTQDRAYALRAVDPSGDQKLGTPGADWLALRGLSLLSSAPVSGVRGGQIKTSGVDGGWKNGIFSYPIWPRPLDADAVRSLMRHPALRSGQEASTRARLALGVEVLTCRISRSEQGGYGAFSRPSWR